MTETCLPPGWAWAKLNDLAAPDPRAITDGPFGSNLKTEHYTEEGPRVIRLQNIGDGVFRDDRAHISDERYQHLLQHAVKAGDILIAALGDELPRACIVPASVPPAIVKADCFRVRTHPEIDPKYLLAILNSPPMRAQAAPMIAGIGRPRLNLGKVRDLLVPVPSLAEQRRIVVAIEEEFSRLDAGIVGLESAALRIPSMVRCSLEAAIPIPCPAPWRLVTVADVGEVTLGRQRAPKYHVGSNMRQYLRVANVFEDRIDITDVMEMHFDEQEFERFRLRPGDVLLNEGQSPELLGRPAMYRGIPEEVAYTNSLLRFRAYEGVLPEWALLVFRRHLHTGRFARESRITTNLAHLSASRFKAVEFPVPPLQDQLSIIEALATTFSKLDLIQRALLLTKRRAAVLRSSILAAAFSGRLVPQDPNDEPASALLERIAASKARSNGTPRTRRRRAKA